MARSGERGRKPPARTVGSEEFGEFLERVTAVEEEDAEAPARWERFFREVNRLMDTGPAAGDPGAL